MLVKITTKIKIKEKSLEIISRDFFAFIIFYHMVFLLLDNTSITNTIAATISRMLIKFPPLLKSIPINQNKTTNPPNQRKKGIF